MDPSQTRPHRRSGESILNRTLQRAETREKKREEKKRGPPQVGMIGFVRAGFSNPISNTCELGEHPTVYTSKGTSTDEGGDDRTMTPRPRRCEVPLDYERINRI